MELLAGKTAIVTGGGQVLRRPALGPLPPHAHQRAVAQNHSCEVGIAAGGGIPQGHGVAPGAVGVTGEGHLSVLCPHR